MSDALLERANRDEMIRIISRRAKQDGRSPTAIDFLELLRYVRPAGMTHGVFEPSFCLIVQGAKQLLVGPETFDYGALSYVTTATEFPASGRVTQATSTRPYLALRVKFTATDVASVVTDAGLDLSRGPQLPGPPVFVGRSDAGMQAGLLRLLQLLDDPAPSQFLAESARRELLYRLLRGDNGALLFRSVKPQNLGVGRAVEWLRRHFTEPIDIVALAKTSRMSVSSLRHEFKTATAMAPLQFQKQLRLQEARRLMLGGELDAGTAAFRVGYESQSQFTREYRRLFGAPPIRHVRGQRESSIEQGVMS
jgi:AraC-like DNA-binding protein